jgi:membrane protein required for colicin V production
MDIVLGVIFLVALISGYHHGFLRSLFSLLAIVLGILGGFKLMGLAMVTLSQYYTVDKHVLPYLAFGIVFLVIAILVGLAGRLLKSSLEKTLFGSADKPLGALLGVLKTAFMASVLLWLLDSLSLHLPGHWVEDSWLYPPTAQFAPRFTAWIGEFLPPFADLFKTSG